MAEKERRAQVSPKEPLSNQELLGHSDISTTIIYTHVMTRPDIRIVSPLDRLCAEVPSSEAVATVDSVTKLMDERVEKTETDGDGKALLDHPF